MSNYYTTNDQPLPIAGATGNALTHTYPRFSGKGGLTQPPLLTPCLEAKALVDLDGIAFQIWYPIGKKLSTLGQT